MPNLNRLDDTVQAEPIDVKRGYGYKEGLGTTLKLDDPAGIIRFNFGSQNGRPPLNP
jgi:hypothetical protein